MLTNPFQTPIQSICRRLPSILDAHLCWPRRRCVITPLRRCCVPFKMGFILLTFTGTSLTLIFHPLHMSILYRCNRKKKLNPILRSETSLTENKAPVSDKLQQCRKSSHRKVPCQDPWDSGNDHRAKWKSSAGT